MKEYFWHKFSGISCAGYQKDGVFLASLSFEVGSFPDQHSVWTNDISAHMYLYSSLNVAIYLDLIKLNYTKHLHLWLHPRFSLSPL